MSLPRQRQQTWQRTVTWGEALRTRLSKAEGGLLRHIAPSQQMLGEIVGSSHNTWRKLTKVQGPEELDGSDLLRAWLLLITLGEDPADWGVDEKEAVPAGFDRDRLRRELPALVAGARFELATSGLRASLQVLPGGRARWQGRAPGVVPALHVVETGAAA